MTTRDRQLVRRHFETIAGYIRNVGLTLQNGTADDRELWERCESIALAAEAYGRYHRGSYSRPNVDPALPAAPSAEQGGKG